MGERLSEIPVRKEVRDMIKRAKGTMTYNEYFRHLMNLEVIMKDIINKKRG